MKKTYTEPKIPYNITKETVTKNLDLREAMKRDCWAFLRVSSSLSICFPAAFPDAFVFFPST